MGNKKRGNSISVIQKKLMKCNEAICQDVENDPHKDYFRGLVFEKEDRNDGIGAVVVGINPGRPKGKWEEPYLKIVEKSFPR